MKCCLMTGFDDLLSGSVNVISGCESDDLLGLCQQAATAPHSTQPSSTWSTRPQTVQCELAVSEAGEQTSGGTAVSGRSVVTPTPDKCPVGIVSTRQLSSGRHSLTLQPAKTSTVADRSRQRPLTSIDVGNMRLRDLLSCDDSDAAGGVESHQEPQSTSCDDTPDSSTGNATSILKQLLADSDNDEQNEVSPQTTHNNNNCHVLLKVCVVILCVELLVMV